MNSSKLLCLHVVSLKAKFIRFSYTCNGFKKYAQTQNLIKLHVITGSMWNFVSCHSSITDSLVWVFRPGLCCCMQCSNPTGLASFPGPFPAFQCCMLKSVQH